MEQKPEERILSAPAEPEQPEDGLPEPVAELESGEAEREPELPVEPEPSAEDEPELLAPEAELEDSEEWEEPPAPEPEEEPEEPALPEPAAELDEEDAASAMEEQEENGNRVVYIPIAPEVREAILRSGRSEPEPEPLPPEQPEEQYEQPEEYEEEPDEEEEEHAPRFQGLRDALARRAERPPRAKRTRPSTETPDDSRNFREAAHGWERIAARMHMRSLIVLALTVISAYLSCAQYTALPCPLRYDQNPRPLLGVLLVLAAAAVICAGDVMRTGLRDVYWGQPGTYSLAAVTMLVTMLHAVVRLIRPAADLPYLCAAMLILYAAMRSAAALARGKRSTCKAGAISKHPAALYEWEQESTLMKDRAEDFSSFWTQMKKRSSLPQAEYRLAPVILIAAPVLAFVVCLGARDIGRLPYALSGILIGGCPLCTVLASSRLYESTARQLLKNGVSTAGCAAMMHIRRLEDVVMTDGDLFPHGTVRLERVELRGQLDERHVLAYAAAVAGENVLGDMLREEAYQRYAVNSRARELEYYEGGGRSASIGGLSILFGPAEFMRRMGVVLPGAIEGSELFLAADQRLMAVFTVRYLPSKKILRALQTVVARDGGICLDTSDSYLTPQHVERIFGLPKDTVRFAMPGELPKLEELPQYPMVGLLSRDSAIPYLLGVEISSVYCRLSRRTAQLAAAASVLGMLIMACLSFLFAPASATPLRVLGYLILWYLPTLMVLLEANKA